MRMESFLKDQELLARIYNDGLSALGLVAAKEDR